MPSKIPGLDRYLQRLATVPPVVKRAVKAALDAQAADLAGAIRRAAPIDPTSSNPGALRDSVHVEPVPGRELSVRVVEDGRDAEGHMIAAHVEYGHVGRDGVHVAARPHFWPTYRARKRAIKRKLSAAARAAIKNL